MHSARVLLLAVAVLGFGAPDALAKSAKAEIEAANAAFTKAYNSKDVAAVAKMYAEDAMILPSGAPKAEGRASIEKFWKATSDFGLTDFTLKTVEVKEAGDWAYEVGDYTAKVPGKDKKMMDDKGKYIVIWKKAGGKWMLYRDIWNDDAMPGQ